MKFKVTATIPVELEIDCQSKEEALDTATTILQEQRDDGDYASIVADCIESALVSGSITMTAVDDHEALVNELRTKRKISIDNHIFYFCRTYAHAGEQYSRREGDFYPIMEFLHSAGEQLLREDIRRYDIKPAVIRTKEEMHEFYRTQPDEMILAALVEVDDKVTGKRYCSIRVWCSGHEVKTRSMGSYYVLNKHYLTVNKDDMVATYPYPFSCDDGANTLLEAKDTDILTPVERLFLWTEYKNPNPIETKKK